MLDGFKFEVLLNRFLPFLFPCLSGLVTQFDIKLYLGPGLLSGIFSDSLFPNVVDLILLKLETDAFLLKV